MLGTQRCLGGECLDVEYADNDTGLGNALQRTFDAQALQPVVGRTDAGRVDEPETDSFDIDCFFDDVAGRSGDLRNDSPFFIQ